MLIHIDRLASLDASGGERGRYFSRAELSWPLAGLNRERSKRFFARLVTDEVLFRAPADPAGVATGVAPGVKAAVRALQGAALQKARLRATDLSAGSSEAGDLEGRDLEGGNRKVGELAAPRGNSPKIPGFYEPRYSLGPRGRKELDVFEHFCEQLQVPVARILPTTLEVAPQSQLLGTTGSRLPGTLSRRSCRRKSRDAWQSVQRTKTSLSTKNN